jgi:serine/threonine-protein kinase
LDATVVMPRTAETGATTVLNIPEAPAPVESTEKKKRSPWTWPLVALVGVLVLVLIGAVVALTSGGNTPEPTPTESTQSASPTKSKKPTATPTGSATPTAAAINKADYVGKSLTDATAALEKLNMNVNAVKGTAAPSADKVGVVYDVNPTGPQVANGTTINVTYYGDLPVAPAPTAAPSLNDDNATPGQALIATWAGYASCPSGHSLESYTVLVDGTPVSSVPNATAPFTAPSALGGHTIAYQVTCSGLAISSSSPNTNFTVSALG